MSDNRILLVSGFLPSPRVPSGGQRLVYDEARRMSESCRLTLLAFCNEHEKTYLNTDDFSFCEKAKIFCIDRKTRLTALLRFPYLPLIASSRFAVARKWMQDELISGEYSKAIFEFIQVGELCRLATNSVPTALVVHDLFHEAIGRRSANAKGIARMAYGWESRRTEHWEASIFKVAGSITTLTQKDSLKICRMGGRDNVTVRYPNKQPSANYRRSSETIRKHSILFFGQMSRDENVDGVCWFAEKILPRIRSVVPDAHFVIAGANPKAEVMRLASDCVEVTGFVDDPEVLFSAAHIAVAPLRLGAGIKIKVVEYIAAGIPTVATPIGAEGVESSPLLRIAIDEADCASACLQFLDKGL